MRIIITFFILGIIQFNVNACSCIGKYSIAKEIRKSDLVVKAVVKNKEEFFVVDSISGIKIYQVRYNISIESIFKGHVTSKLVNIISGIGNGDCGFKFEIGEEYIIYANYQNKYYAQGNKVQSFLYTDICKRTRKSDREEISQIEKKRKARLVSE